MLAFITQRIENTSAYFTSVICTHFGSAIKILQTGRRMVGLAKIEVTKLVFCRI